MLGGSWNVKGRGCSSPSSPYSSQKIGLTDNHVQISREKHHKTRALYSEYNASFENIK